MDDDPDRGADGKSHAIGDAVADPDEFETERPYLDDLAGDDLNKLRSVEQVVLPEFFLDQGKGEGCSVYRDGQFADKEGNGAYVVFMAVRYDKAGHLVSFFEKIAEIGNDYVDTQHLFFGKHQAGVDNHNGILIFEDHHVEAYFAKTTEWDDLQSWDQSVFQASRQTLPPSCKSAFLISGSTLESLPASSKVKLARIASRTCSIRRSRLSAVDACGLNRVAY